MQRLLSHPDCLRAKNGRKHTERLGPLETRWLTDRTHFAPRGTSSVRPSVLPSRHGELVHAAPNPPQAGLKGEGEERKVQAQWLDPHSRLLQRLGGGASPGPSRNLPCRVAEDLRGKASPA